MRVKNTGRENRSSFPLQWEPENKTKKKRQIVNPHSKMKTIGSNVATRKEGKDEVLT